MQGQAATLNARVLPRGLTAMLSLMLVVQPVQARSVPSAAVGSFGPFAHVEVRLAKPDTSPGESPGTVTAGDRRLDLPQADEPAALFDIDPRRAVLLDVDRQRGNELVVLYFARKVAPDSLSYWASLVYGWDGAKVVRLRPVEQRLEGCSTAAAVARRLRGGRCR